MSFTDLMKLLNTKIKSKKLQETLLLSIASLSKTYQATGGNNKAVGFFLEFFLF